MLYTWDAAPQFVRAAEEIGVVRRRAEDPLGRRCSSTASSASSPARRSASTATRRRGRAPRLVELSDRESEVLALIAKGLTNAQIADELYLSIETVKTYVKRLYAKLDVHNRAQAAVAASSHQLTPR